MVGAELDLPKFEGTFELSARLRRFTQVVVGGTQRVSDRSLEVGWSVNTAVIFGAAASTAARIVTSFPSPSFLLMETPRA